MRGGNWGGRGERIDFANLQVRFRQSRLMSLHCNLQRVLSVLLQLEAGTLHLQRVLSVLLQLEEGTLHLQRVLSVLLLEKGPIHSVRTTTLKIWTELEFSYIILIVEFEDSGIGVDCRLYIQPPPIDDGNVWLLRDYLTSRVSEMYEFL